MTFDFVTNVITFTTHESDDMTRILDRISTHSYIDFDKIIPRPNNIKNENGSMSKEEYLWKMENWGVKWYATDCRLKWLDNERNSFRFSFLTRTAWPHPIINTLFHMFTNLEITYYAASEHKDFVVWKKQSTSDTEIPNRFEKQWNHEEHANEIDVMFDLICEIHRQNNE